METKTQDTNSGFSWTSQKGLVTVGLFVVAALVCEFFIVNFFAGSLLAEMSADALAASLLYLVLPVGVIIVLVSSWIYLTKHVALGPKLTHSSKTTKVHRRRPRRKTQKSFTQSISQSIKNGFNKISSAFSDSSKDPASQKPPTFSKAALESTLTLLTIFLVTLFLLAVLFYPRLFTDFATGFYSTNSPLQEFMKGLADALVPIASGLDSIASGFRDIFGGLASASSQSLTGNNALISYVLCQSAAAAVSVLATRVYVKYYTRPDIFGKWSS